MSLLLEDRTSARLGEEVDLETVESIVSLALSSYGSVSDP